MKKIGFFFAILFLGCYAYSQHAVTVTVNGVESNTGVVSLALYTDEASFLKFDKVFKTGTENAVMGTTVIQLKDIPSGKYAIAVFHDENADGELSTNFLGIPKEAVAFSKAKMKAFGPPSFDACVFEVNTDVQLTISLE